MHDRGKSVAVPKLIPEPPVACASRRARLDSLLHEAEPAPPAASEVVQKRNSRGGKASEAGGSLSPRAVAGKLRPKVASCPDDFSGVPSAITATTSAADLAGLLGLSARTIRDLAAKGTIPKASRGRYSTAPCVAAYVSHLREAAAGRGNGDSAAMSEMTAERLREARERADQRALANAKARGEMVKVDDVRREWQTILRDVKAAMMAVPSRYGAAQPHLSPTDIAALDREVRAALEGLADDRTG